MKHTFLTLDGMRGIAAIFVLISHTGSYWGNFSFAHTYLAVDMFFILSGFVIAHAYESKLISGEIKFKDFVLIRLIRLYPMYFISVLIVATVYICKYLSELHETVGYLHSLISSIVLTFFFLPSFLLGSIKLFPLNGSYWSIFYEIVINFLYALLRPILSTKILKFILVFLAILMTAIAFLNGSIGAGFTWRYTSIATGLTRSGFGIFCGIYLYRLGSNFFPKLIVPNWVVIGLMSVVLMLPHLGTLDGLFDLLAIFIIFPFCVYFGVRCNSNHLTLSIFRTLGQASYPIYLLHVPISALIYSSGISHIIEEYAPISGGVFVIFMIYFSIQLEKLVDLPIRVYLSKRYLKKV